MTRNRTADFLRSIAIALVACTALAGVNGAYAKAPDPSATIHYRFATIDGVKMFYREAGPADGPVVLLLHGFPTSSHMFRNLIPLLADRYHVIAPDYPGYGQSDSPDRAKFKYTFATLTDVVDKLLAQRRITRYAMYVMDYGAPVGYRLALKHPERVSGLIIQNGNAYEEGLREFWDPIKAYWVTGRPEAREKLRAGTTLAATRAQYLDGVRDPARVDPSAWTHDQARLDRPGNVEIQLDLFYDYRTNVELYPQFQKFFRERRPPTLIVWGRNDVIFPTPGALAYLKDQPDAELHLLDTGHFALEDKGEEIARLMRDFLGRHLIDDQLVARGRGRLQ